MLAKGLVPLVLIAPLLWIAGRRWADLLILAGATIVVAAPWYVLCYLRNGRSFIKRVHLETSLFPLCLTRTSARAAVVVLHSGACRPIVSLVSGAGSASTRDQRQSPQASAAGDRIRFVFFSSATNKLPGYLLPLLPSIAAIAGVRLTRFQHKAGAMACRLRF